MARLGPQPRWCTNMLANEIGGEGRQLVNATLAELNGHVAAHDLTGLRQALANGDTSFLAPRRATRSLVLPAAAPAPRRRS